MITTSSQNRPLALVGGRVIDPVSEIDRIADVLIYDGKIETVADRGSIGLPDGCETVDVSGQIVAPGFIDLHTHLRTPGEEWKEDFASGSEAAARGGFTTICAMPNTYPPPDNEEVVKSVVARSRREASVNVLFHGTITARRAGAALAPMYELADTGVVGFSDDGDPVSSSHLMRQALTYSSDLDLPVINHAEDRDLAKSWDMNEGAVATRLGLRGIPSAAETSMIARDIELCRLAGGRLHVPHVSAAGSVELIRRAKADGIPVTAEITPHHVAMTDDWVYGMNGVVPDFLSALAYETNSKMAPPLRSQKDCDSLIDALVDGTIDAIATDHAPHGDTDKVCTFTEASNGIIGLETAFSLLHGYAGIDLRLVIRRLTQGPRSILNKPDLGALLRGSAADLVVIDPDVEWRVDHASLGSKSMNTPLAGLKMKGRVTRTLVAGQTVWSSQMETGDVA